MQRRRILLPLILLTVAGIALAVSVTSYTPSFRERRFAQMSLDTQLQSQARYSNDSIFLYHLGRKLNTGQRFAEALPILERAVGLEPESARNRDEWARALLGTGHVTDAYGELREFAGTHPGSGEAYFLLGKFYVTQVNYEPARRALEKAVELTPDHAAAWSLLAHVQIKEGAIGSARESLEKALKLRPNSADDHLQLAVLVSGSDLSRARQEYQKALALTPSSAVCHRQYGRFLLDSGDATGAEQQARQAVGLDSQDPYAALLLGRALLARNQLREALPSLEQAARLSPADPQPADSLRRTCRRLGDLENAERWDRRYSTLMQGAEQRRRLLDATQAHPNDKEAHQKYAAALAQIGDVNGCVQQHGFARKTALDNPVVLVAAARDLDRFGYSAEALPLIRRADALLPQNPQAHEVLGDTLLHLGRLHEAAIHYERIRDWKPEKRAEYQRKLTTAAAALAASPAPIERLLRQAEKETDPARAETVLKQALAFAPDNTRALRALLRLQFLHSHGEDAAVTANRLVTLSPEDGLAHTLLVLLSLEKLGERPLSESDYQMLSAHLQAGASDFSVAPTFYYARGFLELKHGQAQEAVHYLEMARRLDPNAVAIYRRLADAWRLAGNAEGARQAEMEFERRVR